MSVLTFPTWRWLAQVITGRRYQPTVRLPLLDLTPKLSRVATPYTSQVNLGSYRGCAPCFSEICPTLAISKYAEQGSYLIAAVIYGTISAFVIAHSLCGLFTCLDTSQHRKQLCYKVSKLAAHLSWLCVICRLGPTQLDHNSSCAACRQKILLPMMQPVRPTKL